MQNTPVAVAHSKSAGSSDISSCNYAARAFGVSSGKRGPCVTVPIRGLMQFCVCSNAML